MSSAEKDAPHLICMGCGATAVGPQGDPTDVGPSDHCGRCLPWICEDCGQLTDMLNPCPCWVSLDGMALADLKALFALGDLSLSTRVLPTGESEAQ